MRKAVQLIEFEGQMWALADDGTIWVLLRAGWERAQQIPQDDLSDNDAKERT